MEAKLVYLVDDQVIELESMELESLDRMTYSTFSKEEDIINSIKYQDKLGDLSKEGQVKVCFDGSDIPMRAVDYLASLEFNPFSHEQYLDVLVGDKKVGPTIHSIKENIFKNLYDVDVVQSVYDRFYEKITPYERFMYCAGMLYEDNKMVYEGLRGIVNRSLNHANGYFIGRAFVYRLGELNREKQTNKIGTNDNVQIVKK